MTATQLSGHTEHALGGTEGQERNDGKGWYQVGIEREGEWVMASTRVVSIYPAVPTLVLLDRLTKASADTTSACFQHHHQVWSCI